MTAYLGYDPGGVEWANGCAIITDLGRLTALVSSVEEAFEWFEKQLKDQGKEPTGVGIDTFTFWEIGRCGWRRADEWLRQRYPKVRGSVVSSNSAQGSMAVQGMAFAIEARRRWPTVQIFEAHPKVLYYALSSQKYLWSPGMSAWLRDQAGWSGERAIKSDHEFDALVSAWAAMMGQRGVWKNDLRRLSDWAVEPAGPVRYPWPE